MSGRAPARLASVSHHDSVRLYSVKDAAERISMSERWLYLRIAAGEIPVVELGGTRAKTRIRADDLQAFIDSRTHGRRVS